MYSRTAKRCAAILSMLLATGVLRATEITQAGWHGPDFILAFSDSTAYSIDLLESDSSQMVIRFPGATKGTDLPPEIPQGEGEHRAVITDENGGLRLTIAGRGRLGYSTEWLPYSRRLVIHTFDWAKLNYQQQQFHKGLLALEAHLDDRASELLGVAYATGERRAGTTLGIHYARLGKDSLALRYLGEPAGADAFLALADVDRRMRDTAGARANEARAHELLDHELTPQRESPAMYPTVRPEENPAGPAQGRRFRRPYDIRWIAIGIGLIVLLLGLVVWSFGKSIAHRRKARQRSQEPAPVPPPPSDRQSGAVAAQPTPAEPARETSPTLGTPLREAPASVAQPSNTAWTSVPPEPSPAPQERRAEPAAAPEPPPPAAPVIAPVTEAPQPAVTAPAPAIAQAPAIVQEPSAPEPPAPIATPAPAAAPTAVPDPPRESERTTPSQAAEVRQKIQSQRKDMPAPAESTVAAARRLHVSRDNVELRRRMAEASRQKDNDR